MTGPATPPPLKPGLEQVYAATEFVVFCPQETILRIGQALPSAIVDIFEFRKISQAAVVTAWNPFSEELPLVQNETRMVGLKAQLADIGVCWLPAEGRDPSGQWAAEPSLLLLGADDELLNQLMRSLEQFAVVRVKPGSSPALMFHPLLGRG